MYVSTCDTLYEINVINWLKYVLATKDNNVTFQDESPKKAKATAKTAVAAAAMAESGFGDLASRSGFLKTCWDCQGLLDIFDLL